MQLDGKDFSGDRIGQRHLRVRRDAAEAAHEERLSGEKFAHQPLHQTALHLRLQIDARSHVEHRARLGVDLFVLMQLNLQRLHDVADDFVFHATILRDDIARSSRPAVPRLVEDDAASDAAARSRSRER